MRNAVFMTFFIAFAIVWAPGAYSQAPIRSQGNAAQLQRQRLFRSIRVSGSQPLRTAVPQKAQPTTPAPSTATPPQAQPQSQPAAQKKESVIEVKDNKLSVDVDNADLGAVMTQIGAKMHVPVQVNGAVYGTKISTKFSGLDIDQGIQRLLDLAGERNYLILYNETGAMSSMELYADNPSLPTPGMTYPSSRFSRSPLFRRRYRRFTPPQPRRPAQQQGQPTVEQVGR